MIVVINQNEVFCGLCNRLMYIDKYIKMKVEQMNGVQKCAKMVCPHCGNIVYTKFSGEYAATHFGSPDWEPEGFPFDDNFVKIFFEVSF